PGQRGAVLRRQPRCEPRDGQRPAHARHPQRRGEPRRFHVPRARGGPAELGRKLPDVDHERRQDLFPSDSAGSPSAHQGTDRNRSAGWRGQPMNRKLYGHPFRTMGAGLLLAVAATAALAGGPNYVYDNVNKIPYVWKMENWPNGQVPVYTDLGNLTNATPLTNNAVATNWAVTAWDQWNNVLTSTFRAHVVGDVSLLGLSDITTANVAQVFPHANLGGVTVVYDADASIFNNYLGLRGVLGVSFQEFAAPNSNEILEGTVFINGSTIASNDPTGTAFSGVF